MNGGKLIAEVLARQGVRFVFTLCGGHIAPILVEAKARGLRVVDVRHEVTAVFAADAVARLTGVPGVAVVTAGPGVTNTITAVKNAQLAQSPLVLLGGATATLLRGRGSLQDIDQLALVRPHVKWAAAAKRVRDLVPLLERAFAAARSGVPGPVFLECPVDLLYDEPVVRPWYGAAGGGKQRGLRDVALRFYLNRHVERLFAGSDAFRAAGPAAIEPPQPSPVDVRRAAETLARAERPVMVVGSQALLDAPGAERLAQAVARLGVPVYLSGMARGLLGASHELLLRHKRKEALREADCVLLCGVPCDFRLDYGRHIGRGAALIAANRSASEMRKNRRPTLGVLGAPDVFLLRLEHDLGRAPRKAEWARWLETLRARDAAREADIAAQSQAPAGGPGGRVNPLALCRAIDAALPDESLIVADGGDFVSTASYVLRPRGPLSWIDPGVFGTLGVGAGFALGAKLARPSAEVWLLYGDGSAGYSLAEADTFARHGLGLVAVIGNDAGWTQIAREQVDILGDDVGTVLRPTDYERAAEGLGGVGIELADEATVGDVLRRAQDEARAGRAVYVNARLGRTDFRKGSLSM